MNPTPDHIDAALSQFFRAEVPATFPPLPVAADRAGVSPYPSSHIALAASVLLLLGFGLWLSQSRPQPGLKPAAGTPGLVEGSTADGTRLRAKP
jgi:hypothetical protein